MVSICLCINAIPIIEIAGNVICCQLCLFPLQLMGSVYMSKFDWLKFWKKWPKVSHNYTCLGLLHVMTEPAIFLSKEKNN